MKAAIRPAFKRRRLGEHMKKQALMVLTTLSLFVALAAVSAYAHSDMRLKANIPFEFSVGNKVLPAGDYTVTYIFQDVALIQSKDGSESQSFFTIPTVGATGHDSSLVFHRYGDQYFLAMIWRQGTNIGHELFESRAERELSRARRALASAKSGSGRETVSINAQR
jgi:hypothetical protein